MAAETKAIQRRKAARAGSPTGGDRRREGCSSANQIRIAALSVINSPDGRTRAGTWRMGLILAQAGVGLAVAARSRRRLPPREARPISVSAASTGAEP